MTLRTKSMPLETKRSSVPLMALLFSIPCSLACGSGGASPRGVQNAARDDSETSAGDDATDAATTSPDDTAATPDVAVTECDDPPDLGVYLVGRYDGCDDRGVRMRWSGSGFVARFEGTGLRATLDGQANEYTLIVDGEVREKLVAAGGEEEYQLASGLDSGEHVVEFYRRTEASLGDTIVVSIEVDDGGLLEPPQPPARRIEIVGDSISCGYGNEGADTSCGFTPDTENHYLAYGPVMARALDAESSTVAWSGKGVVFNYGDDTTSPLPFFYERAVSSDPNSVWDFEWQADAVVINLSTNDYSTDNDPSDDEFTSAYAALLETIRGHYPDAFILCTVGPMLSGNDLSTARANITAAVSQRSAAGDDAVEAYSMTTGNPSPGCDWHPSVATHAAIAEELGDVIAERLGW